MAPSRSPPLTVVKVGGSLAADGPRLRAVLDRLAHRSDGEATAIVPGGGPFADAVRTLQATAGFSDALAHRLALDAMGRMAEVLCGIAPGLNVADSPAAVVETLRHGGHPVWDPVALKGGHPDIAENWDVTSDSLALWLATRLRAERCILIKSTPIHPGASLIDLARLGVVDAAFPRFASTYEGAIEIRGAGTDGARQAA